MLRTRVALVSAALMLTLPAAAFADTATPIDLGTLPGTTDSVASTVNNRGLVFGFGSDAAGHQHGIRWNGIRHATDLKPLPGYTDSGPVTMNEGGVAIGNSSSGITKNRATKWGLDGKPVELPGLPAFPSTYAAAINDGGTIAGYVHDFESIARAVKWAPDGHLTDLGVPNSRVRAINNKGAVIGWTNDTPLYWAPDGTRISLELPAGDAYLTALADDGTVVGSVSESDGTTRAAKWDSTGKLTRLDATGWKYSGASLINANGVIAGDVSTGDARSRAARWDAQGRLTVLPMEPETQSSVTDLNANGVTLGEIGNSRQVYWDASGAAHELPPLQTGQFFLAYGLNDNGEVVGAASVQGQGFHAVIWQIQ